MSSYKTNALSKSLHLNHDDVALCTDREFEVHALIEKERIPAKNYSFHSAIPSLTNSNTSTSGFLDFFSKISTRFMMYL